LTLPPDQLVARRDLEDSNVLDLKTARALARTATTAALARAEIALEAVDAVVGVSCTGYATPSIGVCLVGRLIPGRRASAL
jgi:predicted naringenin-chalcone synthase